MTLTATHVHLLAAALFSAGLFGVIARREPVASLASVAVMAIGVAVNAAAIGGAAPPAPVEGQALALVTTLLAATLVAAGLISSVRRRRDGASGPDEGGEA